MAGAAAGVGALIWEEVVGLVFDTLQVFWGFWTWASGEVMFGVLGLDCGGRLDGVSVWGGVLEGASI